MVVTGVGQRVGLHLATTFLQRGLPVVGTYRTERPALSELARQGADLVACDFTRPADMDALLEHITSRYASLRALIHNASDWLAEGQGTPDQQVMQTMLDVHVTAPYRMNLALAGLLQGGSHGYSDIIHIGDYVSSRGSRKHIAYAASKAAQDNLTLSFAAKLAPNVKVNSIAPALIMFNDDDDQQYRERALAKNLLHREGGLAELQHQVDYLLGSQFVTGRIIHMDGGRHLA
jgi:dihydromonapterin reductase/dihydrofolate reductase